MATIGQNGATLSALARQTGSDGRILEVAETLNKILGMDTIHWKKGNLDTGNEYSIRTQIPTVGTRGINQRVAAGTNGYGSGVDTLINLEAYSSVDKDLYEKAENKEMYLMNEAKGFIEAMGQRAITELFKGDRSQPDAVMKQRIDGFQTRFNLSTKFPKNVLLAGGSPTNRTSAYLIAWGDRTAYGFCGKNQQAGLNQGETKEIIETALENGVMTYAPKVVTPFTWKMGLTVEDYRSVVRYANVDYAQLKKDSSSGVDLIEALIKMAYATRKLTGTRGVYYMNVDLLSYLDMQQTYKGNALLTPGQIVGETITPTRFRNLQVQELEILTNDETAVV